MNQTDLNEESSRVIEDRAEFMLPEDFRDLTSIEPRNVFSLKDSLTNNVTNTHLYCGVKGLGKTLTVKKVLNDIIRENQELTPCMILFKDKDEPYILNPIYLADKPVWGDRLSKYQGSAKEILLGCDIIILDDIHYMFEAIARGDYHPDQLYSFLENLLELSETKKITMLSEINPNFYTDMMDLRKIETLFSKIGIIPYAGLNASKDRRLWVRELSANVRNLVGLREVLSLSFEQYIKLAEAYNVKIDSDVLAILYIIGSKPRNFVRFINLFSGYDYISSEMFNKKVISLIKKRSLGDTRLKNRYINSIKTRYRGITPPDIIIDFRNKFYDFTKNYPKIKNICDKLAEIIGSKYTNRIKSLRRDWYSSPHVRLIWAEDNVRDWFNKVLEDAIFDELSTNLDRSSEEVRTFVNDLRTYYRNKDFIEHSETYLKNAPNLDQYPEYYLYNLTRIHIESIEIGVDIWVPREALEFALNPVIKEIGTLEYLRIFNQLTIED